VDLGLLAGVLWRSKFLVVFGLLVACALAVLAMAKPELRDGRPTLVYRQQMLYQRDVTLLVTQVGFPEGRTVYQVSPTTSPSGSTVLPKFAEPSRFADLAVLYAELAMSDRVQRAILQDAATADPPIPGGVVAAPVPSPSGAGFLPLLRLNGISTSPERATQLAQRASAVFTRYLERQQQASHIPAQERVQLVQLATSPKATVYQGRKSVRAIFAFLLVIMLTIAAAFIRENLRQRRPAGADTEVAALRSTRGADGGDYVAEPLAADSRTP
jgi:hypothetical protein